MTALLHFTSSLTAKGRFSMAVISGRMISSRSKDSVLPGTQGGLVSLGLPSEERLGQR